MPQIIEVPGQGAVEFPDGMTDDQIVAAIKRNSLQPKREPSMLDSIKQGAIDLGSGAIRGAGSIGATLVAPVDMAIDALDGKGLSLESNRKRRQAMDDGLRNLTGADTDSFLYQGGKLAGEIAGTAGAGGLVAQGAARAAPALAATQRGAQLLKALSTGGMSAGGGGLGVRAAGGAVNGAVSAGMVNPEDAVAGGMIGGAFPVAGKALGTAGSAIGRSFAGKPVSPEVASLAKRANDLGISIPADRLTNSRPMNAVASALNYVPFSGRAATEDGMQSQLNRALSRTFGQDSDNVAKALGAAQSELGSKFDDVLKNNQVRIDDTFLSDLAEAADRAAKELGSDGQRIIQNQIDEIIAKGQGGAIDGQAAYNIKRTLDRIGKRNSPEAHYALDLKKNLMGALDRSLGAQEAQAFATTRKQYGNMLALDKLAKNGADGDVSIARVANMRNINNPDLQELADISAQFLKPREGQHGAAQRAMAGVGLGSMGGLPALLGSIGMGRAANSALNSNAARNFVLGQSPQLSPQLMQLLYRSAPQLGVD